MQVCARGYGIFLSFALEKLKMPRDLIKIYSFLQLIVSTVPDAANGKSPSIINANSIKLLFDIQKKVI